MANEQPSRHGSNSSQKRRPQLSSDCARGDMIPRAKSVAQTSNSPSLVPPTLHTTAGHFPTQGLGFTQLLELGSYSNVGGNAPVTHIPDNSQDNSQDNNNGDPGIRKGRGPTKGPKPYNDPAKRMVLTRVVDGQFSTFKATQAISFLLRFHWDTKYTSWDSIPDETKEKMWNDFKMRFRWESVEEVGLRQQWEQEPHLRFIEMLCNAHQDHIEGYRSKFLSLENYKKLVEYWKKPEVQLKSEKAKKNRGLGLVIKENGEKSAKATFKGGACSMSRRDMKKACAENHEFKGLTMESYVETHVFEDKEGDSSSVQTSLRWIDDVSRTRYENYMKIIEDKYKDNPDERPGPRDPIDVVDWTEANGGDQSGRVPGISIASNAEAQGFNLKKRRKVIIVSSQTGDMMSLQEKLDVVQQRLQQTEEAHATQLERVARDREILEERMATQQRQIEQLLLFQQNMASSHASVSTHQCGDESAEDDGIEGDDLHSDGHCETPYPTVRFYLY